MQTALNDYGDLLVPTSGSHGADIASQRIDTLDHRALAEVLGRHPARPVCVDLGCGLGLQGLRFAALGAEAHLFDLMPEPPLIEAVRTSSGLAIAYRSMDLRQATAADFPARLDLAFSQRFVHYLPFVKALALLRVVAGSMAAGSPFFLSASGIDSELGTGYGARDAPLANRFGRLAQAMQDKHDIREEVCLYREADLERLMAEAGFAMRSIDRSAFGNLKGMFEKLA